MNKSLLFLILIIFSGSIHAQDVLVDTAYRKFNVQVVTNSVNKAAERKIKVAKEVKAVSN